MLKTLIKKQFLEVFRSYFVDTKTSKALSKGRTIAKFIGFGVIMLLFCFVFLMMAYMMKDVIGTEYEWLYFSSFSIVAIAIGTFASVFVTNSTLYSAKDNDQLLSLPIETKDILLSRICVVLFLGTLYSGFVWLPAVILYWFVGNPTVLAIIIDILILPCIGLIIMVLSCIFGFIVAKISNKFKNRSLITVILSLAFMGAYFYVSSHLSEYLTSLLENGQAISNNIKTYGNLFYRIGVASIGDILSFLIIIAIAAVLSIVTYRILLKSFNKIVINASSVSTVKSKITYKSSKNVANTLLKKEFKRFVSSPLYLLNCGLGVVFIIVFAVLALIKANEISAIASLLSDETPEIFNFVPLIIVSVVCMVVSINCIVVPSVSLEGKCLWILKSLPIRPIDIINAKQNLDIYYNGIPSAVVVGILCYVFKVDLFIALYAVVITFLFIRIKAGIGMMIGLLRPNFIWTSEVQPIKQSTNILYAMLISFVMIIIIPGAYYLLMDYVQIDNYLLYLLVFFVLVISLIQKWMANKGCQIFEEL